MLTVTGGSPPFSYDWSIDERQGFDDNKDLSSIPNGFLNVVARDFVGCTKTLDILVTGNTITSLETTNQKINIDLYPNPSILGKVIIQIPEK